MRIAVIGAGITGLTLAARCGVSTGKSTFNCMSETLVLQIDSRATAWA